MIGLKRHTVQVVEHDPGWASLFEYEAHAIRRASDPLVLDLQHVGSTAVPGLPAKPVLDIAVAVRTAGDIPKLVKRLTAIGYIDRGDGGRDGGYLLVRDSEPEVRIAHLHIIEQADPQWRQYIAFRDILRRYDAIRAKYGEIKKQLAAEFPKDRKRYAAGKDAFIRNVLRDNPKLGAGASLPIAAVTPVLEWWFPRMQDVLKEKLHAAVLYGSAVLGDFQPHWSDVDVCTVLTAAVTEEEAVRIGRLHDEMRDRFIGGRAEGWTSGQAIEGPYIPLSLAADPERQDWCYVAGGTTRKRVLGHPVSPFDRYVLSHHGVCWKGTPTPFAPPTRISLLRQLEEDLRSIESPSQGCLNSPIWLAGIMHWLARSIVFWRDGILLSKTAALEHEIAGNSSFAGAFLLALQLRREGSMATIPHLEALRRNFLAINHTAATLLRKLACGADLKEVHRLKNPAYKEDTMSDSSTQSWDAIADDWTSHADTNDYRNVFLIPVTLGLMGNVAGKSILDLGCGEGGYSRILRGLGAHVTAVDGSSRLIRIAGERAGDSSSYLVRNANNLHGLADASFEVVLAAMSLMDVEDYPGAIAETHRVLRPGGRLVMSITHPCFSGQQSKWKRNESGELECFQIDRYMERQTWEEHVTAKFRHPVIFRHMPLTDFVTPLLAAGFRMTRFHEPLPTPEQIEKAPRLARLRRIPYFLFIEWTKE